MTAQHSRQAALAILGLFVLLSLVYSVVNPIFEAPDEVYHYPYVKHLADGYGLPVQRLEQEALWEQEGSQPPLYHALSAALTFWIDTDDLPQVRQLNPHARIGIPLAEDNKNMVLHDPRREALPWRGTVLAVHLIRFFSVLLGAGTLWCTYRLGRNVFPRRPWVALGAMLLNALNPMFVFISSSINNDNLIVLLSSVVLLMLVRIVQRGTQDRQLLALGIIIGLACLSKLSGVALVPLAMLALALRQVPEKSFALRKKGWRRAARRWLWECALVCIPVLLVAGWWYLRNWRLYGELTGVERMLAVFGRRSHAPSPVEAWREFKGFCISFWGLFGIVNVLLRPLWLYKILDAFSLFCLIGIVRWGIRAWRERRLPSKWRELLLLGTWIIVIILSLFRWTMMTKASQGRLIFPAISAICLFLSLGFLSWFPERSRHNALGGLALLMGALTISAPFTAIQPAYAPPPVITEAEIPASASPYCVTYGGMMELVAYRVEAEQVRPGESFPVTLYWKALAPMDENLSIYIHLFGRDGQPLGQRDSYHGGGNYPSRLWTPGEIVADTFSVPVRLDAAGPVAAEIEVGLYRLSTMGPLPAFDAKGNRVGRPVIGRIKVDVPTASTEPGEYLDVTFGNQVRLVGYDLQTASVQPGASLSLSLHWHVIGGLERDYTVFVHLVDGQEQIVGQGDAPPMNNDYPTSFWGVGETLVDKHRLEVKEDAAPGVCGLFVGLYDPTTGERLPLSDSEGNLKGDRAFVTQMEIREW
ncbi:MAG: glycosyltransferase family 39 protein [Chloroflexota bacterium]|nr:glycosyltransferase family 39 protein [Chloroflexota bacterium]